ncbi:RING/U-BOX SUPERFAMILY PROTEIN [Salix viminalis]|uniref:RING/U-BOX SUPERFAMILY PROTEIN n=1 Tax=Salix viminalis TaxID=40686 RepID=A0A9Q0ZDF1_SALVM|nr:RING/U-BOX SUPERFAMILY PROTEIN [Salix viminalis]
MGDCRYIQQGLYNASPVELWNKISYDLREMVFNLLQPRTKASFSLKKAQSCLCVNLFQDFSSLIRWTMMRENRHRAGTLTPSSSRFIQILYWQWLCRNKNGLSQFLTAIESDSDEEESDEDSSSESNADDNDYEFFQSHEFESEMEFLQQEGQDSNSDEDMEEDGDEVDSDELSYEDLIALGEFVGQERRGTINK